MSMTPPAYQLAKICFLAAALIAAAKVGTWLLAEPDLLGWERITITILVFSFCGVGWIESWRWIESRQPKAASDEVGAMPEKVPLSIELAPRVVIYRSTYKSGGETFTHYEYGFGIIAHVRDAGANVRLLQVVGEIDADVTEYISFFGQGKTEEEIDANYREQKPYYNVSFIASPNTTIGQAEFFRFLFLDPANLGTQTFLRVGTDMETYFGFRGKSPRKPKYLTKAPSISFFVRFGGSEPPHGAGNARLLAPRLRDEFKDRRVNFQVKLGSKSEVIRMDQIQKVETIFLDDWNKQSPQDIFLKNNIWDRAMPTANDPAVEKIK